MWGALLSIIRTVLTKIWKPVYGAVSGFFVWLWQATKRYFARRSAKAELVGSIVGNAKFSVALGIFITSVCGVFVGLIVSLINVYNAVKPKITSLSSGGSVNPNNPDPLALFSAMANSLRIFEALSDVFVLFAPLIVTFIGLMGSILYYKIVMKTVTAIAQKTNSGTYWTSLR